MCLWAVEQLTAKTRKEGEPLCDASKNRMVAINFLGKMITFVQDPDVIQDTYNKHAKNLDKNPLIADIFEPMMKNVFGLMRTDTTWKA